MIPHLVIVGRGRIGTMTASFAAQAHVPCTLLGRDDDPEPVMQRHPGRPILVATRNDAVEGLLADVHPDNLADLVFVQNGMIRPVLEAHGVLGATQGVLTVAVPRIGATPEPGGESVFWGPWATEIAWLLSQGGVPARAVPELDVYLREVGVKLAWICIFGLLGSATGLTVGEVARRHRGDVVDLCAELAPVLNLSLDTTLPVTPLAERILEYSHAIPSFRATLKEWPWRNGWLIDAAAQLGLGLPRHAAWLALARRAAVGPAGG